MRKQDDPTGDLDPTLQATRCTNLRHLVAELQQGDAGSWNLLGELLGGLTEADLRAYLKDRPIPDAVAREIEWATHRPRGWLDRPMDSALDA